MNLAVLSSGLAIVIAAGPATANPTGSVVTKPKASTPTPARGRTLWTEPLTGMVFVLVPKGCFTMGTKDPMPPSGSQIWDFIGFKGDIAADEKPQHQVCLDSYWIARNEVRLADWRRIAGADFPGEAGGELPKGNVTWEQATRFAALMTKRTAGIEAFRLPTEAEWERACRAGLTDEPSVPDILDQAWFVTPRRAPLQSSPTGRLVGNNWGIFDMLGNVWEWTADSYSADAYSRHALFNPRHDGTGNRVMRGGSYRSELVQIGCGRRSDYPADDSLPQIGFRLVMTRAEPPGKAAK
jgi:formylglycine-generating enzyme required for sulfatase activity